MKIFLILVLIFLTSSCSDSIKSLPSRTECIIKVELLWKQNITEKSRAIDMNLLLDSLYKSYFNKHNRTTAPPASQFHGLKAEELFLQYTENCDDKFKITHEILSESLNNLKNLESYKVDENNHDPGRSTIDVSGSYWR